MLIIFNNMTVINEDTKQKIIDEYNLWVHKQYGDKTLSDRQEKGQFFTPPELTIKMIGKLKIDDWVLDPCAGSGNLLAAAIIAGADPNKILYNELDPEIFEIGKERLKGLGVPDSNFYNFDVLESKLWDDLEKRGIAKKQKFKFGLSL